MHGQHGTGGLGSSGSRQQGVGEKTNLSGIMLRSLIEVLAVRTVRTCLTSAKLNKFCKDGN